MKDHIVRIPHALWLAIAELAHEQGRTVTRQICYDLERLYERHAASRLAPIVKPEPTPEPVSAPLPSGIPHYNKPVQESFELIGKWLAADAKRRG